MTTIETIEIEPKSDNEIRLAMYDYQVRTNMFDIPRYEFQLPDQHIRQIYVHIELPQIISNHYSYIWNPNLGLHIIKSILCSDTNESLYDTNMQISSYCSCEQSKLRGLDQMLCCNKTHNEMLELSKTGYSMYIPLENSIKSNKTIMLELLPLHLLYSHNDINDNIDIMKLIKANIKVSLYVDVIIESRNHEINSISEQKFKKFKQDQS
jgi:hypothetical protein